jgi:hypothetical protein
VFSAPIAAVRVRRADIVAGLIAAEGVLRVTSLGQGGSAWSVDALSGVSWTPDADLRLLPAADGTLLVWRGLLHGRRSASAVLLGPKGQRLAGPFEVGPVLCTTSAGVAWIAPGSPGPARVLGRRWTDPLAREAVAVPAGRSASVVCGDHDVFVLGEGDDDLTASPFAPGDVATGAPVQAMADAEHADDERDHETFTAGDDLGLVRIGSSGVVTTRTIPAGGAPSPWHRLDRRLQAGDDVVAVDGDAGATWVVFEREVEDACGAGPAGASVHVLRVDRATGAESALDLAGVACDATRGPFWIASAPTATAVAWVERAGSSAAGSAPVRAIEVRVLASAARASRIALSADAVADEGCDQDGCFVAALVRPPGDDATRPERIAVLRYP